jgi:hypothetical protein
VNRSADPVKNLPVKLEIDGRLIDTRTVNINSNSTGTGDVSGGHRGGADARHRARGHLTTWRATTSSASS